MAENTAMRNNALPYPVYGVPWTVVLPILDADGDPVTDGTIDSLVSINGDTAAAGATPVQIATTTGLFSLALTAANMTADIVCGSIGSTTSGAKRTLFTLYPRKLVALTSGTSQGGAVGYITLAASAVLFDNQFNGCLWVATIDTNVEARVLQVCTSSNQQCTVTPNWNVAPDADDTYIIYLPEGRMIPQVNVKAISDDSTAADNCELMFDGTGYAGGTAKLTVDLSKILGTALTETQAGYLVAGFKKVFDVAVPLLSADITIQAGCNAALVAANLDHLALTATDIPAIPAGTYLDQMMDDGTATYDRTTDSLQAIRDKLPANLEDLNITDTTGLMRPDMANASGNYAGTVATVTTLTNAPTGMALEATLTAMKGATFSGTTDSLEAIRDRGDAAWITATSVTVSDKTGFSLANGSIVTATFGTCVTPETTKTNQLVFTNTNKVDAAVLAANDFATAVAQKFAAIILRRTMANIESDSNGDTLALSSLYGLIQQAQESSVSDGTLTVKQTNGSTTLGTKTVTSDAAADPITGIS